jgi:hypothetical protein
MEINKGKGKFLSKGNKRPFKREEMTTIQRINNLFFHFSFLFSLYISLNDRAQDLGSITLSIPVR